MEDSHLSVGSHLAIGQWTIRVSYSPLIYSRFTINLIKDTGDIFISVVVMVLGLEVEGRH